MSFRTFFDYVIIAIIQSWNVIITLKCSFVPVVGAYPCLKQPRLYWGVKFFLFIFFKQTGLTVWYLLSIFFFLRAYAKIDTLRKKDQRNHTIIIVQFAFYSWSSLRAY